MSLVRLHKAHWLVSAVKGRDRGRGQVEGLVWQDVERIASFAEADKTIAGLRDSAMIRLMSDCLLRVSEVVAVDVGGFEQNDLDSSAI